jgi:hypothetical protein
MAVRPAPSVPPCSSHFVNENVRLGGDTAR